MNAIVSTAPVSAIRPIRVLLVDLNNFSLHPTMAIGYLAAVLRREGFEVAVFSPLAHGIAGVVREPPETLYQDLGRRFSFALAQMPGAIAAKLRSTVTRGRALAGARRFPQIVQAFGSSDPAAFDAVLVSAYLMYHAVCFDIGRVCAALGVPMLIGGSYFAEPQVARQWLAIPGLRALIGGEVELEIPRIVAAAVSGEDLAQFEGVTLPDGRGGARRPLLELDAVPFPDYSDFPWHRYPHRIVPMLAGRGCGWGACTFCSDVISSTGRTYRSRSAQNVLDEIEHQARRHDTALFAFADLKLNSDLGVWDALLSQLPQRVTRPRWIGSVHVGSAQPNGLDLDSLRRARAAGMVRLTTGLESGSQRVLDGWAKGTDLATTSRFLRDAHTAGISVRVTMIHGAPHESAEDVEASADFVNRHMNLIDRVTLNRFQIMLGSTFQRRYVENPARVPNLIVTDHEPQAEHLGHEITSTHSRRYLTASQRLLHAVHKVNRKPLPQSAAEFSGVM